MKSKGRSSSLLSAFQVFSSKSQKKQSKLESGFKEIEEMPKRAKKRRFHEEAIEAVEEPVSEDDPETGDDSASNEYEATPDLSPEDLVMRPESIPCGNKAAEEMFKWLLAPFKADVFFEDMWEKRPLLIERHNRAFYKDVLSCKKFDKMMRENFLEYSKNIDVTSYEDGERKTLNPEGRAYASVVWDYFQQGCSIRLLNPQTYSERLWAICSFLQEYFGSFVGVNMYLTPAGTQGFAPHYDDIEAFVLQLEGEKHWKVYSPRNKREVLPSNSSANFSQDEIGTPLLETVLQPGDLLYFPRGYIHQAKAVEDTHSLHITISTYQKNTWGDLLKLMLPRALELAMAENVEFRQSLPKDYMNYVGVSNTSYESPERDEFMSRARLLGKEVLKYLPVDYASDQHAKDFIHGSLPPCLTKEEKKCSIHGSGGSYWKNERIVNTAELIPGTKVRLIRKRALRIIMEENSVRIYHNLENSRIHKEWESKYVESESEALPALELLTHRYPEYIRIEDLPFDTIEAKMEFSQDMYGVGFLMTEKPLLHIED